MEQEFVEGEFVECRRCGATPIRREDLPRHLRLVHNDYVSPLASQIRGKDPGGNSGP